MKILHCSDLHLGKKLFGYPLYDEQKDMMKQLMSYAIKNGISAILIAGDLYDQAVAPYDAMALFERFLIEAKKNGIRIFCIGGNHDSSDRLEYNKFFLDESDLIIRSHYLGTVPYFDLVNPDGRNVRIHLLPFIRPYDVQPYFEKPLDSYQKAYEAALSTGSLHPDSFNILVAHQYISGGKTADSEVRQIGGLDQIDPECLNEFDYCALGHLHRGQKVKNSNVYYPGTLLRFGKDETGPSNNKHFNVLTITDEIEVEQVPFTPLHDLVHLRGNFDELIQKAREARLNKEDFYWITLTDEKPVPEVQATLRGYFPRMVQFEYESLDTGSSDNKLKAFKSDDPMEMIAKFYNERDPKGLNANQLTWIEKLWEEVHETN